MPDSTTPPTLPDASMLRPGAGPLPLVVAGRPTTAGQIVEVPSPASPNGGRSAVHADARIVANAAAAAESACKTCAALSRRARAQILRGAAGYLGEHADDLAVSLTLEVGKSLRDSRG